MQVERTLDNVIAKWIPEIKDFAKDAACFLVGINAAKVDYPEDAKPVDFSKIVKVTRIILALFHLELDPLQSCYSGILHKTGLLTASKEQERIFTEDNQVKWF